MIYCRAAVPHRVMKDDHYREYDIPAGCMIIPNIWSVTHAFREHPFHQRPPLQGDVTRHKILPRSRRVYPRAPSRNRHKGERRLHSAKQLRVRVWSQVSSTRELHALSALDGVRNTMLTHVILSPVHVVWTRVCPGKALADASIWLAIASIIALFDILKPVDDAGAEYTPPATFISAFSRSVFRRYNDHMGAMAD